VRGQELSQELLAGPGGADLVGRVVGGEHELEPDQGLWAELRAAAQQQPTVRPRRVDLHPAPVLLLAQRPRPLPHVGDYRVAEHHQVEVVIPTSG